jgi:hypothetical protein
MTSTFMTHLLQTGQLQAHIAQRLQPAYAARYHILLRAITTHLLPLGFTLPQTDRNVAGGFFIWLGLPEGFAGVEFARVCAEGEKGVIVAPGAMFEVPGDYSVQFDENVRLCFAWESEENLEEGIKRIRGVAERLLVERGEGEYVFVHRRDAMRGVTDWRDATDPQRDAASPQRDDTDSLEDAASTPADNTRSREDPTGPQGETSGSQVEPTSSRGTSTGVQGDGTDWQGDISDNVRIPWVRRAPHSVTDTYTPVVSGKWWSAEDIPAQVPGSRAQDHINRAHGHVGRIMETTLGEQFTGDARCDRCKTGGFEC